MVHQSDASGKGDQTRRIQASDLITIDGPKKDQSDTPCRPLHALWSLFVTASNYIAQ